MLLAGALQPNNNADVSTVLLIIKVSSLFAIYCYPTHCYHLVILLLLNLVFPLACLLFSGPAHICVYCTYMCVSIFEYVCTCVVFMCVYLFVSMCTVYICVFIHVYACACVCVPVYGCVLCVLILCVCWSCVGEHSSYMSVFVQCF